MILNELEEKINKAYSETVPKKIYKNENIISKLNNYLLPLFGILITFFLITIFTIFDICQCFTPFSIFIILCLVFLYDKKYHQMLKEKYKIDSSKNDDVQYKAFKKALFDKKITENEIKLINKKLKHEQSYESSKYSYKSEQFVKNILLFYVSNFYIVLALSQFEYFIYTKMFFLKATIFLFIVAMAAFIYFNFKNIKNYSKEKIFLWLYYIELEIEHKNNQKIKKRKTNPSKK